MTDEQRAALVDRDRLALIIQGAMSEHLSVDALEMEVDGTGPASYRAADRILDEIVPAIRADERKRSEAEVERLRAALQDIANSDDIENALDPERNKRVARTALAEDQP